MTRSYAARRLLEHGPLTFAEFTEITGWRKGIAGNVLQKLMAWGLVCISHQGRKRVYAIAT